MFVCGAEDRAYQRRRAHWSNLKKSVSCPNMSTEKEEEMGYIGLIITVKE